MFHQTIFNDVEICHVYLFILKGQYSDSDRILHQLLINLRFVKVCTYIQEIKLINTDLLQNNNDFTKNSFEILEICCTYVYPHLEYKEK